MTKEISELLVTFGGAGRGHICGSALPLPLTTVILRISVNVYIKNTAGFLNLGFTDILDQMIHCCVCGRESFFVPGRMFSNIPGLFSLDSSSTPPSCDNQICFRTLPKCPLGGRIAHEDTGKWEKLKKKIISVYDIYFTKQQKKRSWMWAALQIKEWSFHHLETFSHTQGHFCLALGLFWRQQADKRCSSSIFLSILKLVK